MKKRMYKRTGILQILLVFSFLSLQAQNRMHDAAIPSQVRDTIYVTNTQYLPARTSRQPQRHIALKTNLLYDAALLPNLTFEWYLGRQWSLAIENNVSWWTFNQPVQSQWVHRIQAVGVELRRWIQSPYPLNGHALGIYTMAGDYDVRFFPKDERSNGYLSYMSWSTGLTYAYSMPLTERLNLEFSLGVGYMGGKYYRYNYCMPHEEWTERTSHNRSYIGPMRAGISIVWLLGTGNDLKTGNAYAKRQY